MEAPFEVGDTVRLRTGTAPQIVENVAMLRTRSAPQREWCIKARYASSLPGDFETRWRRAADYVHFNCSTEPQQQETSMAKLYQTKAEPRQFGTFLAKDSTGKIVLELKGSGDVKPFAPSEIEEVRPYTVRLNVSNGGVAVYEAVKGSVEVGDLLILPNGAICTVTAIDTKESVSKVLIGARKLATTPVEAPDSYGSDNE